MKKHILIIGLCLFAFTLPQGLEAHCGSCGVGDVKKKTHKQDKHKHDHMIRGLNLSEKQSEDFRKAYKAYKKDVKKADKKLKEKLKTILTKKQLKMFYETKKAK